MEDRRLHHAGHIGGIRRRARFIRQRRESDLVVDDQVDGAAGGIAVKLRKIQRLRHHALARERRVAMNQQRNHALPLGIAQTILLRPHDALDHRIHGLEMAWIGATETTISLPDSDRRTPLAPR